MRTKITLACTECKQRNYDSMKNKKNNPDRLEMHKYIEKEIKPGIKLHTIKTEKFKTNLIAIFLSLLKAFMKI